MNKRILFYSSVRSKKQFVRQEFYRTDIKILRNIGFNVILSNKWYDFLLFWKYDLAFIYFYRFGLLPSIISKILSKQAFFTGGIDYLDKRYSSQKEYLVQALFYNLCSIFSSKNIIVSESDLINCEKIRYLCRSEKQILCKHSINDSVFSNENHQPKEKLVVTIAWMERSENVIRKGVLESLEFFASLIKKDPEFRMIIIGSKGAGSALVESRINELGLSEKVILTGGVSELTKVSYLNRASVYLQLSKYEGFGIAAIEALMARCLVIHTGAGGLAEGVGMHGILWRSGETEIVLKKLFEILGNTRCYENWVDSGREYVLANYSLNNRTNAFASILPISTNR